MYKAHFLILALFTIIFISPSFLFGQSGKISGTVVDSTTNEPVVGVNVMIIGTNLGAATDIEGKYFIINVPIGKYSISASYIGYAKVTQEEVVVNFDRTTTINFSLTPTTIEGDEVTITSKRPPVEIDRTSSEQIIGEEDINKTFARTIPGILETKAGVFEGLYRGSSVVQTSYYLDNMSLNSGLFSENYTGINTTTIREISVQTGGYNAEYGSARSAIINVVSKGDVFYSDKTAANSQFLSNIHGTVLARLRPQGKYHFGRNMFSKDNYDWTNYNLDYWTQESQNPDGAFYGQDPNALLNEWQAQITPNDTVGKYTERPQWETEATVYGNILNNMGFMISGRFKRGVNIFPQALPFDDEYNFQGRFTYAFSPTTNISISGLMGGWESVSPQSTNINSYEYSQETAWNGYQQVRDPYDWQKYVILGAQWGYWPEKRNFNQFNISFNNTISKNTYYEIIAGYIQDKSDRSNRYVDVGDKWNDTDMKFKMIDQFVDESYNHNYDIYNSNVYSLKGNVTSQLTNEILMKTGAEFLYYDMSFTHLMPMYEGGERWNLVSNFSGNPYEGNVYYQNKIEFEGMIVNVGLRLDLFNQNRSAAMNMYDVLAFQTTTPGHDPNEEDGIPGNPEMQNTKLQTAISPRIGVSHPLSANTVIHFFYGHVNQRPSWSKMLGMSFINFTEDMSTVLDPYAKQTTYLDQWQGYLGNPYLSYEKTIQYEIGFDQNIENLFLLKVAGFYKDATNEANSWSRLYAATNQYNTPIMVSNSNYSDVRGIEIAVNSRFKFPVNFGITDEIYWSWLGDVGYSDMFEPISGQANNPKGLVNEKGAWSDFNRVKLYVDVNFDKSFGPILSDLSIYLFTWWRTGEPYTYHGPGDVSTKPNNMKWFSYYMANLKISKGFEVLGSRAEISVDVTNLLNSKFLNLLYGDDLITYMENSDKPDSERLPKHWFSNEPNEWAWYSYEVPPRQINVQLRWDF